MTINKNIANLQLEMSNERKETKTKTGLFFQKLSTCEIRRKKSMALKLFEFVEQFMMDTFFVKINPI